jgi:hypothetical protein
MKVAFEKQIRGLVEVVRALRFLAGRMRQVVNAYRQGRATTTADALQIIECHAHEIAKHADKLERIVIFEKEKS